MRARVLSLLVVVTVAGALVSASGAATTRAQKVARIDVSTRAAVVKYLRSVHVNPKGAVIQRGARNYAGRGCLGKDWSCANTRHAVVQIAPRGGQNRFVCGTSKCVVVQLVGVSGGTYALGRTLQSTAATATNTAKCVYTSGFVQLCAIIQLSSSANNVAVVYQQENSSSGLTQAAASGAAIIQRATGASNTNTACVYQAISLADSRTTSSGGLNIWLGAHQNATIAQDSAHGGNSAAASATSAGGCTGSAITQSQTLKSTATGHGAITQNENSASLGPNVSLYVEQNQSSGFKGHATGTNSVVFNQTSNLQAVANTPNGPVSQTQSSPDTNLPYSGLVGTINQDSSGISTASATQTETQCEDAAKSGLTTCKTGSGDADFNGTYALNQTQYGPEGIWQAPKHRSGHRRVPFVHKGYGTATQTGNSGDAFTINQSSTQDNDQGAGSQQTNVVQGDCRTSGNCNITQNTNVDGQSTTNTQSGQNLNTSINCTGSECQSTAPPPPSIDTYPPDPSSSSSAEFTFSDTQGGLSFLCQLDGSGFSACTSPQDYGDLSAGLHTFSVEAKDGNGNVSALATYSWTIAFPGIVFDGSPGTGAPPATLGGYAMTAFGSDSQPVCPSDGSIVDGVSDPTAGVIGFSQPLSHDLVGQCWATWSHGYTSDVYDTYQTGSNDPTEVTITLPAGTEAFYLYAEPEQFALLNVQATAQDGTTSEPIAVQGESGAQYFGFYGINGATLSSITVTTADPSGFAVGEFGISPANVIP